MELDGNLVILPLPPFLSLIPPFFSISLSKDTLMPLNGVNAPEKFEFDTSKQAETKILSLNICFHMLEPFYSKMKKGPSYLARMIEQCSY